MKRHTWDSIGFLKWKCPDCLVEKHKVPGFVKFYFYFRNGIQLEKLPDCVSTYTSDKIIK
jgi:hypothetical protein